MLNGDVSHKVDQLGVMQPIKTRQRREYVFAATADTC